VSGGNKRTGSVLDLVSRNRVEVAVEVAVVHLQGWSNRQESDEYEVEGDETNLVPVESVGLPLVNLKLLNVVAVLNGAESPDVVGGNDIRVKARNENSVIRNVAVRNVPRPEVVVDPQTEEGRVRSVQTTVVSGFAVRGGRGRGAGRLDDCSGKGFDGRLEDLDNASDEVGFAVTLVPGCGDVDVVCGHTVERRREGDGRR
jgi:hypothetical protein